VALTIYSGRPGAGKSYALVEQVILPGVLQGRRVVTNVAGLDPDAVVAHLIAEGGDPDKLGHVVLFDGQRMLEPHFFPTEAHPDGCFVQAGDLLVVDEWRLYFPNQGKMPAVDLEPFLRWHRHLINDRGQSCDVVIGTQLITDLHRGFRGLCHRSYKFKKLDTIGASKVFSWHVYEGHLQAKNGHYAVGSGKYSPAIFALYKSYAGNGEGQEVATDNRASIFNRTLYLTVAGFAVAALLSFWLVYRYFHRTASGAVAPVVAGGAPVGGAAGAAGQPAPGTVAGGHMVPVDTSPWRVTGSFDSDDGRRIMLTSRDNRVRYVTPDGFRQSRDGKPLAGTYDAKPVIAEDIFAAAAPEYANNPNGKVF